ADVTAIAILLLDCADKDSRRGYVRESETIYRPIKPRISLDNEANVQCPDKTKFYKPPYRDGELIRAVHAEDNREVLIVACKSDQDCTGKAMDQIRTYMNFTEFPAGLLLSQRRAFYFFFGGMMTRQGSSPGQCSLIFRSALHKIADIIRGL
ncbi:hypothetical protein IWQ61_006984, partial [Dispira simplex]